MTSLLKILPCLDSEEMAEARKEDLWIPRLAALALADTAVEAAEKGFYVTEDGTEVDWKDLVQYACLEKKSIQPEDPLPNYKPGPSLETVVQVTNETTLQVAYKMARNGERTLALNFANGTTPGGGFLSGCRAQEECLCRSSALYATLEGDQMYKHHRQHTELSRLASAWAILSPDVPVFRTDSGRPLSQPWVLSFATCAAPVAHFAESSEAASDLLKQRIHRILEIAAAYGYTSLVLGAWGCGAFGCDPQRTAQDFRQALENEFAGGFAHVVFAITDWSPERRFLGPFRDVFAQTK